MPFRQKRRQCLPALHHQAMGGQFQGYGQAALHVTLDATAAKASKATALEMLIPVLLLMPSAVVTNLSTGNAVLSWSLSMFSICVSTAFTATMAPPMIAAVVFAAAAVPASSSAIVFR
eukprot:CAMPEP_0115675158 /NCGR_PEP_ID=MMETSP0272-20121206/54004_1 /TAXON_ID=71861 /ORGANISM="Scrippsiella trochoidea, Strain CCMP3099" /LENGTH=117 /DNA_ID=CAMNT_0003114113 /DNA_START=240 /DNA_END=594 /DNA_ORIENTATION=-